MSGAIKSPRSPFTKPNVIVDVPKRGSTTPNKAIEQLFLNKKLWSLDDMLRVSAEINSYGGSASESKSSIICTDMNLCKKIKKFDMYL
jgi:hypothetical protein